MDSNRYSPRALKRDTPLSRIAARRAKVLAALEHATVFPMLQWVAEDLKALVQCNLTAYDNRRDKTAKSNRRRAEAMAESIRKAAGALPLDQISEKQAIAVVRKRISRKPSEFDLEVVPDDRTISAALYTPLQARKARVLA